MSSRPQSPPTSIRSPPVPEAPKESAISRLFIAPLTFVAFILSLALVDSHNHSLRSTHMHSQSTRYGRFGSLVHSLFFKRVAEQSPYGYVKSPTAKDGRGKNGEEQPWHWHTKQRKMMKAEMDDAFRIRGSVMVVMGIVGIVSAVLGMVVVRWGVKVLWQLTFGR